MSRMNDLAIMGHDAEHDMLCQHYKRGVPGYCRECHILDTARIAEFDRMLGVAAAEYERGRDDAINDMRIVYSGKHTAVLRSMQHGGWDFEVVDANGDEFASGTAPTLDGAVDMMREYLHAEYGSKRPAVVEHLPDCPIRRETWCVWPGDRCRKCAELRRKENVGND
jgi:hypothetical protein